MIIRACRGLRRTSRNSNRLFREDLLLPRHQVRPTWDWMSLLNMASRLKAIISQCFTITIRLIPPLQVVIIDPDQAMYLAVEREGEVRQEICEVEHQTKIKWIWIYCRNRWEACKWKRKKWRSWLRSWSKPISSIWLSAIDSRRNLRIRALSCTNLPLSAN